MTLPVMVVGMMVLLVVSDKYKCEWKEPSCVDPRLEKHGDAIAGLKTACAGAESEYCVRTGGGGSGSARWGEFAACPSKLDLFDLADWVRLRAVKECPALGDGEEKCWPRPEPMPARISGAKCPCSEVNSVMKQAYDLGKPELLCTPLPTSSKTADPVYFHEAKDKDACCNLCTATETCTFWAFRTKDGKGQCCLIEEKAATNDALRAQGLAKPKDPARPIYGRRPYKGEHQTVDKAEEFCCCKSTTCTGKSRGRRTYNCQITLPPPSSSFNFIAAGIVDKICRPYDALGGQEAVASDWCYQSTNLASSELVSVCGYAVELHWADMTGDKAWGWDGAEPGDKAKACRALADGEERCWTVSYAASGSNSAWLEKQCCCKRDRCTGALKRVVECQLDFGTMLAATDAIAQAGYTELVDLWWDSGRRNCGSDDFGLARQADSWCMYREATSAGYWVTGCRDMFIDLDPHQDLAVFRARCDAELRTQGQELCTRLTTKISKDGLQYSALNRICCCLAMKCTGRPQTGYDGPR